MQTISNREDLRPPLLRWRQSGQRIAVVPTMGNLHLGHLSLVQIAKSLADRVVVTVFVNPTQFGAGEDYTKYPRTLDQDIAALRGAGVDLLFAPSVEAIYPFGLDSAIRISVPKLCEEFCGARRPGHFEGVATVVLRLFALLQPDVAVFGQKDYQQLLMIRRLVAEIGLPIEVLCGPIIREATGLAMSSRNNYLTAAQKETAAELHGVLQKVANHLRTGQCNFETLVENSLRVLQQARHSPEYFAIRQARDLEPPEPDCSDFVVLAASKVGNVRLIDNVLVSVQ